MDLGPFWIAVEAAVESLDASIQLGDLLFRDIAVLGPLILGPVGWSQVDTTRIHDWVSFKMAVEEVFGLSQDQLVEKFYALSPFAGEQPAKFVMRVETERKLRNLKATEVFHVFSRKLPLDYQR